jgi:hypothetical protein
MIGEQFDHGDENYRVVVSLRAWETGQNNHALKMLLMKLLRYECCYESMMTFLSKNVCGRICSFRLLLYLAAHI